MGSFMIEPFKTIRVTDLALPILPVLTIISMFPDMTMKGVLAAYGLVLVGIWGERSSERARPCDNTRVVR
jgi:hypothetical protein